MKRKFVLSILCIFLILALPLGRADFSVAAYNQTTESKIVSVTEGDALSAYLDNDIDPAEHGYLSSPLISYDKYADRSNITVEFKDNKLSVTARSYTESGLNFTPVQIMVGNERQAGDSATFDNVEGDKVTVEYSAEYVIPEATMGRIATAARSAAASLKVKFESDMREYNEAERNYDNAKSEYYRYITAKAKYDSQYEEYLKAYNKYKREYSIWNSAKLEYEQYQSELAQYDRELAEYNNYDQTVKEYYNRLALYRSYLSDYAEYQKKLSSYEAEIAATGVDKALYQLSVLQYMTKPATELNRTISGAILGSTVTTVLGNTEALVLAGAERAAVNLASEATIALRRLINTYTKLNSDEQRYMFYISSYEYLRDNFCQLLCTLDYFYKYQAVRSELNKRDRTRQYEICLAQLYYICNALNDYKVGDYETEYKYGGGGGYFDEYYTIGGKTPAEVLGESGVLEDRNTAQPLESGYPVIPTAPVEPTPVEDPGATPPRHTPPAVPYVVPEPGAEPTAPTPPYAPDVVTLPLLPTLPKLSAAEEALIKAYEDGKLPARTYNGGNYKLTLTADCVSYFRNENVTLKVYDSERRLVDTITAEKGSKIVLNTPEKMETGFTYTFLRWEDEAGNQIDLDRLVTDKRELSIYPCFDKQVSEHNITFVIGTTRITQRYRYGETPFYDERTYGLVQITGDREYVFKGWKTHGGSTLTTLPEVTGDAVYQAVFDESYLVTFNIGDRIVKKAIWGGEKAVFDGVPQKAPDNIYAYTFAGWNKPLSTVYYDTEYEAEFDREFLVAHSSGYCSVIRDEGMFTVESHFGKGSLTISALLSVAASEGAGITFDIAGNELFFPASSVALAWEAGVKTLYFEWIGSANSYEYELRFSNGTKLLSLPDCAVHVKVNGSFDFENLHLLSKIDGSKTDVRFTIEDNCVRFIMRSGRRYSLCPAFVVTALPSEYVTLSLPSLASMGEVVTIALSDMKPGMFVRSFYVLTSDGKEIEVVDGSFVMPRESVTIGVICDYIEYTITFKADGRTLVTRKLHYGDEVVAPEAPVKPSDGKYSYTFTGWDSELSPVTGDKVYSAIYSASPLQAEKIEQSLISKLIRAMYIVLPVVGGLIIIGIALIIIFIKKKHNNKIKK